MTREAAAARGRRRRGPAHADALGARRRVRDQPGREPRRGARARARGAARRRDARPRPAAAPGRRRGGLRRARGAARRGPGGEGRGDHRTRGPRARAARDRPGRLRLLRQADRRRGAEGRAAPRAASCTRSSARTASCGSRPPRPSRACSAPARGCRRCSPRSARSRPSTRRCWCSARAAPARSSCAHAIHRLGARSDGPFVPINCGAIPETLLESELFGHEKGAFTGAHAQRRGRIETANGGTLFLDEIGELPTPLQVKLLRFLQDHKVERVGGRSAIPVDVRVVAATNADLDEAAGRGPLPRGPLLPPRRRHADAAAAARPRGRRGADRRDALRGATRPRPASKLTGFSKDALSALRAHAWPGNVRELENRVRRAAVMAEGSKITAADLELAAGADGRPPGPARAARRPRERDDQGRAQAQPRQHLADRLRARHQPPDALRPADQVQHRTAVEPSGDRLASAGASGGGTGEGPRARGRAGRRSSARVSASRPRRC